VERHLKVRPLSQVPETEDPGMTDYIIALLEKSSDADLLREVIDLTAQRCLWRRRK
jgi:hypothetical protein